MMPAAQRGRKRLLKDAEDHASPKRTKGTQTKCEIQHVRIQCNMDLVEENLEPLPQVLDASDHEILNLTLDVDSNTDSNGSDYQPSSSADTECEKFESEHLDMLHSTEPKYIVFHRQLMELFQVCTKCAKPAMAHVRSVARGSLVSVEQECSSCGFSRTWDSQPYVRDIPAGNLLMSSAILFSGSLPTKTLLFLKHMGVKAVSKHTFLDHQRAFLHPAIEKVWSTFQTNYVSRCRQRGCKLTLGGDGRADTPGHSAKYGTYTMMDMDLRKVVDVRTVQSSDAGNSNLMEKMGFLKSLAFFDDMMLQIMEFVSDRHPQIIKFMRENRPETIHSIDVWHVAKGLKKKLITLSKERECELLQEWIRSIISHLYWIPASTDEQVSSPEEKEKTTNMKLEKWNSLFNHLHNVHSHNGEHFPTCQHPPLEGRERKKKWLTHGSKLSAKLEDILSSKQLKKDIPMLSSGPQTSALESFHAHVNRYAPKMTGFHYEGISHRVVLAALDFNENSERAQATRKDGKKRFNLSFSKAKKDFTLHEVKVERTYMSHRCYGISGGVVLTCGQGDTGQLGLGEDVFERSYPGLVALPDPVVQVCCGGMHTVCLTMQGEVYTFGCNDEGALGRDTSEEGAEMSPGKVSLPARIVQVSAGDSHTAALTEYGSVLAWGNFRDHNGSIGLTMEGKQLSPVELLKGEVVVKIASGCDHIVCLTNKGEVYTAGCAEQGQLGRIAETFTSRGARKGLSYLLNPAKVHPVARRKREPVLFCDIWTGTYVTFALAKNTKDVYAWGLNNYYQLGVGDMTNRFHPQKVEALSSLSKDWLAIVGGQHHTVALDGKGKVYSLGRGNYGRLGHGDTAEVTSPKLIEGLLDKDVISVAAGESVSFAVTKDGSAYSWGQGDNKQLATGEEDDVLAPTKMKGKQLEGKEVLQVSAGGQHTCILVRYISNSH